MRIMAVWNWVGPWVWCLSVLLWWAPATAAAKDTYQVGLLSMKSGNFNAQVKTLWREVMPLLARAVDSRLEMDFYKDVDALRQAMEEHPPHFLYVDSTDHFPVLKAKGYQVLTGVTLFDEPATRNCLYVQKTAPRKKVGDLKNARVFTYRGEADFYRLWDLVGQSPFDFFGDLKPTNTAQDALYALALGEVDAAYLGWVNIRYMQAANPGPLKKVRQLACNGEPVPNAPTFVHASVPPAVAEKMRAVLLRMHEDAAFERLHPLFQKMGFRFHAADAAEMELLASYLVKARARERETSYRRWAKSTGQQQVSTPAGP